MSCCTCQYVDLKESETTGLDDSQSVSSGRLQFVQAGKSIQHPLKAALRSTNADAFAGDLHVIGIADGVSTVEDEGLDPSELPVELLSKCLEVFKTRSKNSALFDAEAEDLLLGCELGLGAACKLPLYVLTKASVQCKTYGSTTCVLAILDDNKLLTANIGDSQLVVARRTDRPPKAYPAAENFSYATCHDARGRVADPERYGGYQIVYRTTPQQHFFNCPYQFSRMPDLDCSCEALLKKTAQSTDVGSVEVRPGDIVVFGTDGLFDNVFDDDLLELLNRTCWHDTEGDKPPKTSPAVLVDGLLDLALKAGQPPPGASGSVITPFSKAAFDEVGRKLLGGKPDDITAVVAYIVPKTPSAAAAAACAHSPSRTSPPSASQPCPEKGSFKSGRRLVKLADPREAIDVFGLGEVSLREQRRGEVGRCGAACGSHLAFLESLSSSSSLQQQGPTRPPLHWHSRASFPPRAQEGTTPANRASVHSVPKAVRPTDYLAFEEMKHRAQQRVQAVEAARPLHRSSRTSSSISRESWISDKTLVMISALRGLFLGKSSEKAFESLEKISCLVNAGSTVATVTFLPFVGRGRGMRAGMH
ncbi:hypothetical protein Esti_000821 [Eimeria stiedai]